MRGKKRERERKKGLLMIAMDFGGYKIWPGSFPMGGPIGKRVFRLKESEGTLEDWLASWLWRLSVLMPFFVSMVYA
jgi:hypothetical protein